MRSIFRNSLTVLLAAALAFTVVGCAQRLETRAYLLDVREADATPNIRLLAIELTGSAPAQEEYLAEALAIPASAAKLPDEESGETQGRRIFRLEVNGEELTIDELQQEDLMLVLASPRAEVAADLKLLAHLNSAKFEQVHKKAALTQKAAMSEDAAAALEELLSQELLEKAGQAAEAEVEIKRAKAAKEKLAADAAEAKKVLAEKNDEYRKLLAEFDQMPGDASETKEIRHKLAMLDREISEATERVEASAMMEENENETRSLEEQAWTGEQLHRLMLLVDEALEATE